MNSQKVWISLFLAIGLVTSGVARADMWTDYASATDDMIKAEVNAAKDGARDANSAMTKLDKKATALSEKMDDQKADIAAQQAKVDSLDDQHSKLETEIDTLKSKPAAPNSHVLFWTTNPRDREIKAAQRRMADLDTQVAQENATLTKLQDKQKKTAGALAKEQEAFTASQGDYDKKYAELQAKVPPTEAMKIQAAHDQARSLVEKQRETYFDSKFLGSDLALLQQKNKMSAIEVQAMKEEAAHALDNTVIGNYVQQLIAATCSDHDFANACATSKAEAMNYLTKKLVMPPTSSAAPSTSDSHGRATSAPAADAADTNPKAGEAQ